VIKPTVPSLYFYNKGACYDDFFSNVRRLPKKKKYFENQEMQELPAEGQLTLESMPLV
jgi:hypothetical protein